jgi:hypothetical protein
MEHKTPPNIKRYHFLWFWEMVITIDRTNFCLLCVTPKQSEEGKIPVLSYQFSPETLHYWNIRISNIQWALLIIRGDLCSVIYGRPIAFPPF